MSIEVFFYKTKLGSTGIKYNVICYYVFLKCYIIYSSDTPVLLTLDVAALAR